MRKMNILAAVNLLLVMVLATMGESSSFKFKRVGLWEIGTVPNHVSNGGCTGPVGSCIDRAEEDMLDSEFYRRSLASGDPYISYEALRQNNVPCNIRGATYYNCQPPKRANVYNRGCTAATGCARQRGY